MNLKKLLKCSLLILAMLSSVSTISCSELSRIETLQPGILSVAVTSGAPTDQYDPQLWIQEYVEAFAAAQNLEVSWVVVPFNESWLLASRNEVDLVATNVANFKDRISPGATFSSPFLYEQRALRINPEDQDRYQHINDFAGRTIGVVSGMAAQRDVNRRAPDGVNVRTVESFEQLYADFDGGIVDAIAEAEYYTLEGEVIPSHGDEIVLIDHHDLSPGQREESVFVVCDNSRGLLQALNRFIAQTHFPL